MSLTAGEVLLTVGESLRLMLRARLLNEAPGEGLEPSSPEGHQLARHSMG
jgi:hypothetical protein